MTKRALKRNTLAMQRVLQTLKRRGRALTSDELRPALKDPAGLGSKRGIQVLLALMETRRLIVSDLVGLGTRTPIRTYRLARGLRVCRECGCTDQLACDGGCSWIEPDLCSTCAPKPSPVVESPPCAT